MRTYLIDKDKNEVVIDIVKTITHSKELVEFSFSMREENEIKNKVTIFLRQLCNHYFVSEDKKSWTKICKQDLPLKMLNVDRVFDVYRGYKPSGLTKSDEGALLTQMPGKIIKILAEVGDSVEPGQPLIILEAMKMENEIKSGSAGKIKAIHVSEGDAVDQNILLIELELNKEK